MVFRTGVGILTGIAICAAMFGSLRYGRPGTTYVSVVTPPLAFAAATLLVTIVLVGVRPSRVGIDFVAALASEAPFLIGSALYGWFVFFNRKAKKKPYRSQKTTA
jgi:hypothetical protein